MYRDSNNGNYANYFANNTADHIGTKHIHSDFVEEDVDYYQVLGLDPNSIPSIVDVANAFKKRCAQVHPDKGGSAIEYNLLIKAYKTLSDPEKRLRYDMRMSETHQAKRQRFKKKKRHRKRSINNSKPSQPNKHNPKTTNKPLPKSFHQDFVAQVHSLNAKEHDEDISGTMLMDHNRTMPSRSIGDVQRDRNTGHAVTNIMHGGHYDPNVFHRHFKEQNGAISSNDLPSGSRALMNPITSNGDVWSIQRATKGGSGYSFMDCVEVGDGYGAIGRFVADKPISMQKADQYHRMGDITQEHKELTDDMIQEQQRRMDRYRTSTTGYATAGRTNNFQTGLQF